MTGGEVERITDPATIRNIDWADHYETTTPRGATRMFDAAQDLSEREADANALEAYRELVTRLRAERDDWASVVRGWSAKADMWRTEAEDTGKRLEQAEARVDQLTNQLNLANDTLRRRGLAVNATGATNDELRATIERLRNGDESGCATCGLLDDFRAGMGES